MEFSNNSFSPLICADDQHKLEYDCMDTALEDFAKRGKHEEKGRFGKVFQKNDLLHSLMFKYALVCQTKSEIAKAVHGYFVSRNVCLYW